MADSGQMTGPDRPGRSTVIVQRSVCLIVADGTAARAELVSRSSGLVADRSRVPLKLEPLDRIDLPNAVKQLRIRCLEGFLYANCALLRVLPQMRIDQYV